MDDVRLNFLWEIRRNPRDRNLQLVFSDWLEERGENRWASFWRGGLVGRVGLVGLVGLGGRVGRGGLVGRVGRGGLVGLVGLGGPVGRGGLVGRVGRVGLGGLGGRVGRGGLGGLGGLYDPEGSIVLIEGENALVFLPHGYGFSVLVGHVAKEMPHGWILDPCREVLDTTQGDCWVELAAGKNAKMRKACQYGALIEGGFRAPVGCMSMPWMGELP